MSTYINDYKFAKKEWGVGGGGGGGGGERKKAVVCAIPSVLDVIV